MKAGDRVILSLLADRDPGEFPTRRPDIDRPANRHIAFANGPHRCLGSPRVSDAHRGGGGTVGSRNTASPKVSMCVSTSAASPVSTTSTGVVMERRAAMQGDGEWLISILQS